MATTPGAAFRALLRARRGALAADGALVLPGCFDGLVARMAARKGFEALYLSGGGTSALSGVPDVGLVTAPQFCAKITNLAATSGLPVLADADTGFEDATATVHAYVRAGAAALHIEDQVFPKRCGHLGGKELVPAEDFAGVVRRCADAAAASGDPDFVVCARSDARGVEGGSVDATIERLRRYADAGASMLFPEGLRAADEFGAVAEALRASHGDASDGGGGPFLLANMTEFGVSPLLPARELGALGYDVAIFPMGVLRAAARAADAALDVLREGGTLEPLADAEGMLTRAALYDLLQYDPMDMPWDYPSAEVKKKK